MKKVAVLLAAYNGALWLEEQLNSILDQTEVDLTVYISIDKSNDGTDELLSRIVNRNNQIVVLEHDLVFGGAAKNFFYLIRNVDFSCFDYVSLSDQDDIWNPGKLSRAIEFLSDYSVYSGNVTAFYPDGKNTLIDKAQSQVMYDYLFEAAGPGCTYVMQSAFAQELQEFIINFWNEVNEVALHDWFIYAFARRRKYAWYIDVVPMMKYRQHGGNQVGANNTLPAAIKRLRLIKNKWYRSQIIKVACLLELQNLVLVKNGLLNGYLGNLYILFRVNKIRRRARDRFALALALLFNIF